jgi:redox-sensitive bicupin YhaK (pirin superfamily)
MSSAATPAPVARWRGIASAGHATKRPGSHEFSAANVSATSVSADLDSVIAIDHFHMRAPVFAPHPHAGFSAVTYLFEDGEGEFENRDSLGHHIVAQPGAAIWTVAGSGVMHEEFPRTQGKLSHGLQGSVRTGDGGYRLDTREAGSFDADGDAVLLRADADGARVVLIAGRPFREPVVSYGPFIMNGEEQVASAIERYRAGRMGRLESAHRA